MKDWLTQVLNFDAKLSRSLHISEERRWLSFFLKVFAHSGDSWFCLLGLFLVWLLSEDAWKERAAFLAVGIFFMAAAVILLKFLIHRPRPEGEWGQIYRITDPHSFPSGHAARSAALVVMGIVIGPPWFATALALWAPWVGLSRVALGVHYVSDVVVGWVVGAAMGGLTLLLKPQILTLVDLVLKVVMRE